MYQREQYLMIAERIREPRSYLQAGDSAVDNEAEN